MSRLWSGMRRFAQYIPLRRSLLRGVGGLVVLGGTAASLSSVSAAVVSAHVVNRPRKRSWLDDFHLNPEIFHMPYHNVEFTTVDGITLRGWWIPATVSGAESNRIFVLMHPHHAHKSNLLGLASQLWGRGNSIFMFDFRSFSKERTHNSTGHYEQIDAAAAIEFVLENYAPLENEVSRLIPNDSNSNDDSPSAQILSSKKKNSHVDSNNKSGIFDEAIDLDGNSNNNHNDRLSRLRETKDYYLNFLSPRSRIGKSDPIPTQKFPTEFTGTTIDLDSENHSGIKRSKKKSKRRKKGNINNNNNGDSPSLNTDELNNGLIMMDIDEDDQSDGVDDSFEEETQQSRRKRIVLMGASMGGACAILSSAKFKGQIDALVTDCAFASLKDTVASHVNRLWFFPMSLVPVTMSICELWNRLFYGYSLNEVEPLEVICSDDFDLPVLFIHSENDRVVPVVHSMQMYEACPSKVKNLWIVPSVVHCGAYFAHPKKFSLTIANWTDAALGDDTTSSLT